MSSLGTVVAEDSLVLPLLPRVCPHQAAAGMLDDQREQPRVRAITNTLNNKDIVPGTVVHVTLIFHVPGGPIKIRSAWYCSNPVSDIHVPGGRIKYLK